MRYFWIALSVLLTGCNGVNDKNLKEDVSSAVVEKIAVFNGREPCAELMQKKGQAFGEQANKVVMKICGGIFDWEKPVTLSDLKVYPGETVSVCGIASGTSRTGSKVGTRFVYHPTKVSKVNLKPIYPLIANEKMLSAFYGLNEVYIDAESKYCK
ncbi:MULTISPECIES: hypothetical protein [Yersinia]|uniref:Lipoprotein n=1 Tax=Yersinia rochesterensis TaxID=1604335 RepID=A0ABM5SQK3_9GAMM|nr:MULTISPECIES: hypothetical protein [Yersinia]AJI86676.1 putative lipoprotein [Yersinia frederiksenii Y225]AJJ36780.1 putative lipoprotein [Yersinia rochesterensis]QKJ16601.1 hypothetical protein HRD70_16280 [Yersinia kristensenii]